MHINSSEGKCTSEVGNPYVSHPLNKESPNIYVLSIIITTAGRSTI